MHIFTQNEYSPLRSIIVGSALQSTWPIDDPVFDQSISNSTFDGKLIPGPLPDHVIQETEEDLANLTDVLEKENIKVYRPKITCPHWSYSARDILLTVGNRIIECPTPYSSRANEAELYPYLKEAKCEWISAPRPQTENDPQFDAANICKFDDKLLYLLSSTGNRAGAEWLQQQVGTDFEVIIWEGVYAFAHIDSTIASLNKNTIMLNASRVSYQNLPVFLRQHRKIWINDVIARDFYQFPFASKWIGLNILSIDPETVIVDKIQKKLIERLKDVGFRVIELELRHSRTLGGGFHCATLDLERL
jgi:scyllo-inosamine-4-phosphate amidinotransferase 1